MNMRSILVTGVVLLAGAAILLPQAAPSVVTPAPQIGRYQVIPLSGDSYLSRAVKLDTVTGQTRILVCQGQCKWVAPD
jgi:hypothetical protein